MLEGSRETRKRPSKYLCRFTCVLDELQSRFRVDRLGLFARVLSRFGALFDLTLRFGFAPAFGCSRSGNSAFPAPRFHSSKLSGEISPLTNNSANSCAALCS
jgi:hypothetical protein